MAPSATLPYDSHLPPNGFATKNGYPEPLKKNGALDDAFEFEEVTPVIGREYPTANIVNDLIDDPNADVLLRDLAITSKPVYLASETMSMLKCDVCFVSSQPTGRCFLPKARQLDQRVAKEIHPATGRIERQTVHVHASHPPHSEQLERIRRGRQCGQHHLLAPAQEALRRGGKEPAQIRLSQVA